MVRTSKAAPAAVDAGALDDLDLDGMFAEQGDLLFEGFDMELGGMDDIVAQEKATAATAPPPPPPTAAAAAAGPKRAGPRTKKTNPMIPQEESNAPKQQRRKTKRKSKAPTAYEDDGDFIDEAPKKKRKVTLKRKGGKEMDDNMPKMMMNTTSILPNSASMSAPNSKRSKSKKYKETASVAQSKKVASAFTAQVAAAGQFGGRNKRTSSQGSSKLKTQQPQQQHKKPKKGEADAPMIMTPMMASSVSASALGGLVRQPPKPESTFGGLMPSKTTFYPFLEAVPPQPSLKNKKVYPGFDKIFSSFSSSFLKPPAEMLTEDEYTQNITMESPIFKLLSETFESISEKERQAFTDDKKQALLKTIPHMRKFIHKYDRQKVITDVYGLLGLLGRQYNFLKTSLDNMQNWCQTEFTPQEYNSTYQSSSSHSPIDSIPKWKNPFVKVKVCCIGHKEPNGIGPLMAVLPRSAVAQPTMSKDSTVSGMATAATASTTSTTTSAPNLTSSSSNNNNNNNKKKSKSKPGTSSSGSTTTPSVPVPPVPKTYAQCTPQERRARIVERLSKWANELQERHRNHQIRKELASRSSSKKNLGGTRAAIDHDEHEEEHLSTIQLWEFMEQKGFYKTPSSALSLNMPQILPNKVTLPQPTKIRGLLVSPPPPPQQQQQIDNGKDKDDNGDVTMTDEQDDESTTFMEASSNSLFDRLQSLLVEEEVDDDDDDNMEKRVDSDSDDDDDSSSDESLGFLEEDEVDDDVTDPMKASNLPVVDLSQLSLEERTFIQLSRAGLIPTSLFPKVELVLSSNSSEENQQQQRTQDEDFCNVMGKMAEDLSEITAKNNARVAFLEAAVIHLDLPYAKQREDEQASLIAKCQNLIKRNKDKAKKSSSKKKDDLNLPW